MAGRLVYRAKKVEAATATEVIPRKIGPESNRPLFTCAPGYIDETERIVTVYAPFSIRVRELANRETQCAFGCGKALGCTTKSPPFEGGEAERSEAGWLR
jgi:hypothetical protein